MIDEFSWQFNLYSERQICQEDSKQYTQESAITSDTNDKSVIKNSLDEDVKILTYTYGELYPSKHIEMDLEYACTLLHRDRRRVDAFARLIKHLYLKYGTTLKILSRKTHCFNVETK